MANPAVVFDTINPTSSPKQVSRKAAKTRGLPHSETHKVPGILASWREKTANALQRYVIEFMNQSTKSYVDASMSGPGEGTPGGTAFRTIQGGIYVARSWDAGVARHSRVDIHLAHLRPAAETRLERPLLVHLPLPQLALRGVRTLGPPPVFESDGVER